MHLKVNVFWATLAMILFLILIFTEKGFYSQINRRFAVIIMLRIKIDFYFFTNWSLISHCFRILWLACQSSCVAPSLTDCPGPLVCMILIKMAASLKRYIITDV